MVHGEIKVWRYDGKVEQPSRDARGEWTEVAVSPQQFSRHVRHTPVRAFAMNEAFIALDRDGHWQSGRSGDYVVLDDGFLRVETAGSFGPQHRQIAEERMNLRDEVGMARSVLSEVLRKTLVERGVVLADDDTWDDIADDLADAAMATVATL